MPFGLRNAGATYRRLVDKAFHKQIGRNMEVYMDDLIIKRSTEDKIVRDIKETFKTLREINMKLNPKKTMDMTIDQQVALDEALVPHAHRLRIGRSNFRLLSDISSKESTLQIVYDVLRLTPFFKAYLVTAYVLEIYMQEFWATAMVHHHSIQFKMENKKHIVDLESFREMLHICPRIPGQTVDEPPFEEEILAFLQSLGHNIKNSDAYKEYYTVATGATPPKTKASVQKTKSSSDTTVTPLSTADVGTRLFTSTKGKQPATTTKAKSLTALSEVAMTKAQQLKLATKKSLQQTHISQASGSGADEGTSTIPGVLDEVVLFIMALIIHAL
nr:reverse transcriptase domain-containing protein [Tanacetum cinerariifolium]